MHNRRRSAKRKLWEITTYKHDEQHISDSDDDKEEKIRNGNVKSSHIETENAALENWISPDSSFSYGGKFKRDETVASAFGSKEEMLIEALSCSDNDSLPNSQLSISEISCSSKKSTSFCTKQTLQYDFSDDSCDFLMPPATPDIEDSPKSFPISEQAHNISISPPSSPINSSSFNAKGSEWLSAIPWQPRAQKKFCPQPELSSDKKKKYVIGGFAYQLHRLQSREKTAKAFWDHHSHNSKSLACDKESLILKLTEAERSYGIIICRAVSLRAQLNDDESLAAKNIASEESHENYVVFLDYEQYEKLNLSTGCVIQIFPPWKSISMRNVAEPVLLCSYFLQVF